MARGAHNIQRRLVSINSAKRRGRPDAASNIGPDAEERHSRRQRRSRSSRRSARTESHIVGIARPSAGAAAVGVTCGKVRHVGLPENDGPGGAQLRNNRGVFRRNQLMARNVEPFP